MKIEQLPSTARREQELPPPGERVFVICDGFRCLGYVDAQGVWRQDSDQTPIEGVVGWMALE